MLHAVVLFGALAVVETIQRTDQVAGDAADALEGLRGELVIQVNKIAVHPDRDALRLTAIALFGAREVIVQLFLRQLAALDVKFAGHVHPSITKTMHAYYTTSCTLVNHLPPSLVVSVNVLHDRLAV